MNIRPAQEDDCLALAELALCAHATSAQRLSACRAAEVLLTSMARRRAVGALMGRRAPSEERQHRDEDSGTRARCVEV